ncbi:hypothetical protein HPB50_006621 [Hyalomma asiaticum]|uniref:Uncharacterized protein n=1 Tax=Hyalomma asiaticum TaxID=266040 RepID=A0ACB7S5W9_HYAAI|nr:hypothetical protein HPB50_006621 [Hyalomma asiaticum]
MASLASAPALPAAPAPSEGGDSWRWGQTGTRCSSDARRSKIALARALDTRDFGHGTCRRCAAGSMSRQRGAAVDDAGNVGNVDVDRGTRASGPSGAVLFERELRRRLASAERTGTFAIAASTCDHVCRVFVARAHLVRLLK